MTKSNKPRIPLRRSEVKRDYDVGYGKPPQHTRFKPGQSGNRKGRPKGMRNFATDLRDTLRALVQVKRDGRPRKISTQKAALLRLREKALGGDTRAIDRLLTLAQAYNNEHIEYTPALSADDAAMLDLFKARVLSGAVAASEADEGASEESDPPAADSPAVADAANSDAAPTTPRRKIRRLRLDRLKIDDCL